EIDVDSAQVDGPRRGVDIEELADRHPHWWNLSARSLALRIRPVSSVIRRLAGAHLELREHAGQVPDLRESLAQEPLSLAPNEGRGALFDQVDQGEAA